MALEYGMGGSSVYFSKLVRKYYAIEADPEFYADVTSWSGLPRNAVFVLRERDKLYDDDDEVLLRSHPLYSVMERTVSSQEPRATARLDGFESYVQQASRFGEERYDFILIDGFARAAIAFYVLDYIDERSRVAIHDFFAAKNMDDWLICDLLKYYRVEAALNAQSPYVSGGSVIILQKRVKSGKLWHTKFGDVVDEALHLFRNC